MNNLEYTNKDSNVKNRNQYKDYGDFYTYFSKRGYYVATSEKGNFASNGRVESVGNTEQEAILQYKIDIEKRIAKLKEYFERKIKENSEILNSVNNFLE